MDYLKLALTINWAGSEITGIKFRFLTDDEVEVLRDRYLKLMDNWEHI